MSTSELKSILIDKINATQDISLLKEATRLMDIQLNDLEIPYMLSSTMSEAINQAKSQIDKGEFLSHEEANQEIEKWFEK